jgi:hypothetical protein
MGPFTGAFPVGFTADLDGTLILSNWHSNSLFSIQSFNPATGAVGTIAVGDLLVFPRGLAVSPVAVVPEPSLALLQLLAAAMVIGLAAMKGGA